MSKLIYVVFRNKMFDSSTINHLKNVCCSLAPDNIEPNPSSILNQGNIGVGIVNPTKNLKFRKTNVFFGQSFGSFENWESVGVPHPDGNYALFRSNDEEIEIVSDILGTKAVWYYCDETVFIASTSQRAVVKFLGSFKFNEKVIPWMLCNGLLGPGYSWDKRLELLEPHSSLVLNRKEWKYKVRTNDVHFKPNSLSDKKNILQLRSTLEKTFNNLNLNYSHWQLSLSGGYDSRANLCFLPKLDNKGNKLKTVTWGTGNSEKLAGSDANVAKKLSKNFDLQHLFMSTEGKSDSLETILERFLSNGEGRIDHLGGYTDGFNIWKKLFENGVTGVIRGDEIFGSYNFISDFHLKKFIGLSIYSDYENLKNNSFLKSFNQTFPEQFKIREKETWAQWRDRLYQSYLVPIYLTALADLKEPYVEQLNPLLSREIVNQIRQLPDHIRTDKKAFKTIVDAISPDIGYAYRSSTSNISSLMKNKEMVEIMQHELDTELSKNIFGQDFLYMLASKMTIREEKNNSLKNLIGSIKALFPKSIKRKLIGKTFIPKIDMNTLAFRAYIIVKMVKILKSDSDTNSLE